MYNDVVIVFARLERIEQSADDFFSADGDHGDGLMILTDLYELKGRK